MAKPIKSFRMNGIDVSVWQNEKGVSYTIQKSYKKGDSWEKTNYYWESDLAVISALCNVAIMDSQKEKRSEAPRDLPAEEVFDDSKIPF